MAEAKFDDLIKRFEDLKAKRTSWEPLWQEICHYVFPDSSRFQVDRRDKGEHRYRHIIDATAVDALDTLAAGMQSGISSPARQWFRLTTSDPKLDESYEVKQFLEDSQRSMQMLFARSDVYRALHSTYAEMGAFGVGCVIMSHGERPGTIDCTPLTIGEYWLAEDYRGRVDTLYREVYMTAVQMVRQWGKERVSDAVRNAYEEGRYYDEFRVVHAIEPRDGYDATKRDSMNMPWRSVYFEPDSDQKRVLSESGFRSFPALCPRWRTTYGDVYGRGPGAKAVSTSKALQQKQYRFAEAVDFKTRPPLLAPISMRGRMDATLPVYADMFNLLTGDMRANRTAFEIEQIMQEKMMVMGPVLESLHTEMLDPLINMAFNVLLDDDMLPTPPESLQGRDLNVEYVSIMAQAQRNSGMQAVAKFMNYASSMAQLKPDSMDLINSDNVLREIADIEGVPANFLLSDDQVKRDRQQRYQVQMAQTQAEQMKNAAGAFKDVSQATAQNQTR